MSVEGGEIILLLIPAGGALALLFWLGWFRRLRPVPPMETFGIGRGNGPAGLPEGMRLSWLGHSSFRLEWGGKVMLLDPVLSSHVSVARRQVEQPDPSCLEGVDAVLLTHGHMDHFNNETLARVDPCTVHLPRKAENFLNAKVRARHRVQPFDRDATIRLGPLSVHVVPARHGGWRYPWQLGYFACGLVLKGPGATLYYAGDTAFGPHFSRIRKAFVPDIALIPIGGYSPRFFLRSRHLDPSEAVRAAVDLGVTTVIPCHYGAYRVSLEGMQAPIRRFRREILNL